MFWNILLLSLVLIGLSMMMMALNILVKKKGKFPAYQVGHNKEMARMGIRCVKHEEIRCHRARMKLRESGCEGCGELT